MKTNVMNHTQSTPASTWTVTHNLNCVPVCDVVVGGEKTLPYDVKHINSNIMQIIFLAPVSGTARVVGRYKDVDVGVGGIDFPTPWPPITPPNPAFLWNTSFSQAVSVSYTESNATASFTTAGSGSNVGARSATALTGKKYAEFEVLTQSNSNNYHAFGLLDISSSPTFYNSGAYAMYSRDPNVSNGCGLGLNGFMNNGSETVTTAASFHVGDRIGVAFDNSTGKLWFSINGTWVQGDPASGTNPQMTLSAGTYYFAWMNYTCNCGAGITSSAKIYPNSGTQAYAPPTGFLTYQQ